MTPDQLQQIKEKGGIFMGDVHVTAEDIWRGEWLKSKGKDPSWRNWLDAGSAYREHIKRTKK